MSGRTNWAGNYSFQAKQFRRPSSLEELQELVAGARKVHVVGRAHSFNDVADAVELQISLDQLEPTLQIDNERQEATVSAGLRYGDIAPRLHDHGLALANLASLPHISVAGACATGTHGSGSALGSLATAVTAIELVRADGELLRLTRENDRDFGGAIINLGGLGAVTSLTLALKPSYEIKQYVRRRLPWPELWANLEAIMRAAYSVSLFTDWVTAQVDQVWLKCLADAEPPARNFYGTAAADTRLHPVASLSAAPCTPQLGEPGPWYRRLPHFRLDHRPSAGAELQTEYLLPISRAVPALQAVRSLGPRLAPHLLISEIRTVAADDLWLSPAYGLDSLAIHFTWKPDWPAVQKLLPLLETALAPYAARPHWGKLFGLGPEHLDSLYEKLPAFRALLGRLDPGAKFRNPYLERLLFA